MRILLVLSLGLSLLAGCGRITEKQAVKKAPELPRITFIGAKNESGPVIVFVHGLDGDGEGTWKNTEEDVDWPSLVSGDEQFEGATVAVYSYNSRFFKGRLAIDEHARQMPDQLKHHRLLDRPLIFVAHSMGGLLVRQLLLSNPDIAKNVQMICYVSTPFSGSGRAALAKMITNNPEVKQLLSQKDIHDWLDEQYSRWLETPQLQGIPAFTAYEINPILGERVVDENSGVMGGNRRPGPIEADHFSICKPGSRDSQVYIYFANAYSSTSPNLNNQQAKHWPSEKECRELIERKFGGTKEQVLREDASSAQHSKDDVELTIHNGAQRAFSIVFCDASALYGRGEKGHFSSPFFAIQIANDQSKLAGRYLSGFRNPTGWFLVFVRYRDRTGQIVDEPQGFVDLFQTLDPYIDVSLSTDVNKPFKITIAEHTPKKTD